MFKTLILSILLLISIYLLLRGIYQLFRLLPSVKTMRKVVGINNIGKRQSTLYDFVSKAAEDVARGFLIKYLFKNSLERENIELALRRTASKLSYESYIAKLVVLPVVSLVGCYLFGAFIETVTNIEVLGYLVKALGLIIAFLLFFEPKMTLNKELALKDDRVILEMPRFIRTYRYSPSSKSFDTIIEDYLETAKEGLRYDLTVLRADIDLVGEEAALQNFSNRISIPEVREFVTVILTALKGGKAESDMNLFFVENKFQDKIDRINDAEMKKRPEVLDTLNDIILGSLGVLLIAPMAIHSISGLGQMMN